MKKVEYAHTKKKVNRLGFGSWQLGNTEFWGYMSVEDGVQLVKHAIKKGINFFDTAPGYASGMSETIIGMAIKDQRDRVVINTKFGHTADGETDFSVFSLRKQISESLERLQTDYIDSLLLHNPGFDILEGKTLHVQELKKLKEEGLFADERKRALPLFPQRVGIITSVHGAVIHDFANNLGAFGFEVEICHSAVEGMHWGGLVKPGT